MDTAENQNELKSKKLCRVMQTLVGVLGFFTALFNGFMVGSGAMANMDNILFSSWPILIFVTTVGSLKQNRIKKWLLLVIVWNCCFTAGFILLCLLKHVSFSWPELVLSLIILPVTEFVIGLLMGLIVWPLFDN